MIFNYELLYLLGEVDYVRLGEQYPDNTLFGESPNWLDTLQGGVGNCYILAALGALAEFPDLVKGLFLTDKVNESGIYAVRFFIRGKPWIITVDDTSLHFTKEAAGNFHQNNDSFFSSIHSDSLWVPILEKAWAKMKGNYENTSGGWTQNGFRALTGAPVFEYWSE